MLHGVEKCLEIAGMGFMFAPNFHPAMKSMMPIRKKLGIRTIFNILGPLTSPANAEIQLLGVFEPEYVDVIAEVLKILVLNVLWLCMAMMKMIILQWMKFQPLEKQGLHILKMVR